MNYVWKTKKYKCTKCGKEHTYKITLPYTCPTPWEVHACDCGELNLTNFKVPRRMIRSL